MVIHSKWSCIGRRKMTFNERLCVVHINARPRYNQGFGCGDDHNSLNFISSFGTSRVQLNLYTFKSEQNSSK